MNEINNAIRRLYSNAILRMLYRNGSREDYYYNFINQESLHHVQQTIDVKTDSIFETEVKIMFRNINMNEELHSFLNALGIPKYKTCTKYSDSNHHSYIYKNKYCGYDMRIVVHALNDTILTCAYHFEINGTEKLDKIKKAFKTKYHIENIDSDNFLITDKNGNKILFNYQFDAVITYINANPIVEKMVNDVFEKEQQLKELYYQKQLKKLELAF